MTDDEIDEVVHDETLLIVDDDEVDDVDHDEYEVIES